MQATGKPKPKALSNSNLKIGRGKDKKQKLLQRLDLSYFENWGWRAVGQIGRGGYGYVYLSVNIFDSRQYVAIKINMGTVRLSTVFSEIAILSIFRGDRRYAQLMQTFEREGQHHLVMQYVQHTPFICFLDTFQLSDAKHYIYALLTCLKGLKDQGIIHHDIKPSNFMYNPKRKTGVLTDFGLAEVYQPYIEQLQETYGTCQDNNEIYRKIRLYKEIRMSKDRRKLGTELYMPLEHILPQSQYDGYASEIWPVGVIFLQLILRKYYVFNSFAGKRHQEKQRLHKHLPKFLMQLACLFGTRQVSRVARLLGCKIDEWPEEAEGIHSFREIASMNIDEVSEDLLRKMLKLNPLQRISVEEALRHPFFQDLKQAI